MTTITDSRITAFYEYILSVGVPAEGFVNANYTLAGLTINYLPAATTEQMEWVENAKELFDWREQRALDRNTIQATVAGLNSAQREAVMQHVAAHVLQQNPQLAASIATVTNVPLPVTEPVPT